MTIRRGLLHVREQQAALLDRSGHARRAVEEIAQFIQRKRRGDDAVVDLLNSRRTPGAVEPGTGDLRHSPAVAVISSRPSIHRFSLYFRRLVARLLGRESAWDAVRMPVPPGAFGPGSRRPFADYFTGESTVRVDSLDDIVEWLQGCEYAADSELFHERDVWQHPGAFERGRRGDCEDFALWAWRKLAEIGIDAEFCVGRLIAADDRPEMNRQHAWVVYRLEDIEFLFEPAARIRSRMIRPLADVVDEYVPHFAVNHRFDTRAFAGCLNAKTAKSAETFLSKLGNTEFADGPST